MFPPVDRISECPLCNGEGFTRVGDGFDQVQPETSTEEWLELASLLEGRTRAAYGTGLNEAHLDGGQG